MAETMATVDSEEFSCWQELDAQEPFDTNKYYLAQLTCLLANVNRGQDQGAFKLGDFLLFKPEEEEEDEATRQQRVADSVRKAFGFPG